MKEDEVTLEWWNGSWSKWWSPWLRKAEKGHSYIFPIEEVKKSLIINIPIWLSKANKLKKETVQSLKQIYENPTEKIYEEVADDDVHDG